MGDVHPDFAPIRTIKRTQKDLVGLPRLHRADMKSLYLEVPNRLADRLKTQVMGSSTQAIAVIMRWVLETLQKEGKRLSANPQNSPFFQTSKTQGPPWIDASNMPRFGLSGKDSHPMLASLPPRVHQRLKTECKGSLRRVVLLGLEYGIARLDEENLTLRMEAEDPSDTGNGRVFLAFTGTAPPDDPLQAWRREAISVLNWLGFNALSGEEMKEPEPSDLWLWLDTSGQGQCKEQPPLPENPSLVVPPEARKQHPLRLLLMEGPWSVRGEIPEPLKRRRGDHCAQCQKGLTPSQAERFTRQIDAGAVILCSHCGGMVEGGRGG